ncbi:sugar ABC transporter ATP-binding protein [Mesorhizobium sp. M7A.F.Ca.CA.001.07.2.1]|uniref:sugar ABC transporter ATP-binding protein n=3 Tax=Phyllobacteriaceae TaxID=69277 RepID=UPI000FCB5FFC|nr:MULTISPECIES: sugar ABC transporter ATP-binding protein [Mesorhizobium]RVB47676.1 sugar ABC transporter ATP-binding protein [Mesorhizobium sp. M7A.F.Ca.CA.004.05.1.1]MCF6127228.1 sugar ABC transporter ATP-binding protein [Mesorhizobium ciceri]MCQ8817579.1 sugar ABC transporter ATP-binding protein [Mesorhizobium sp. SEMIA396]MCQ8871782.1 sugar ABC transporter ATP-binding protein [Mesorhizobium sp. LMG17149]RUX81469.1 sugar ABC transporter ATP-binding protein [Mesorhizobium sp. M7A.F.Ca.CA.00
MSTDETPLAVRIAKIAKSYGPTVALDSVSIDLRPGEVHALLGENGAGKSTLVKILSGVVKPDSGSLSIFGAPYAPHDIVGARAQGVATAFQELSLLPNLSIAENLMLPKMPRGMLGLASHRTAIASARKTLKDYGLAYFDPDTPVGVLSLSDRQRLEIVRAFTHASKLLILDEPTAALADVEWLFELVRRQKSLQTAILYISHRLGEVRSLCSRATILRNGRSIGTVELSGASDENIFEMMVGRSARETVNTLPVAGDAAPIALSVKGLSGGILNEVSFNVRQGEIVGIAALEGQGQRDLFRTLVGLAKAKGGSIEIDGVRAHIGSPGDALYFGNGLAYLPEDRKSEGILGGLTTASNMVLPIISRIAQGGIVWPAGERRAARKTAAAVDLQERYLHFKIDELSGGNQQKALLARVMMTGARTLLLFDPTRGVDVGTKQSIYEAIRKFAADGGSVLFYSSELPELVHLAHRCIVLYGGRIFAEYQGDAIDEQTIVGALIGHARSAAKGVAA